MKDSKCPKCGGEFESGWLDRGVWRKGKGLHKGLAKIAFGLPVVAYSCKKCGFVEVFVNRK